MTPTYEGRTLPKPDEELVDQGLQFDIATLMGRRGLLALAGGLGAATLAACASATSSPAPSTAASTTAASTGSGATSATSAPAATITEVPDETAGPYPGDGSNGPDVLEQSGIVRKDIRSSFGTSTATAAGIQLAFTLKVIDMAKGNVPFSGAAVYAWHCDQQGRYSMYSSGITEENYLRGVQVADASGSVTFTSVFPGCYDGRWPHIHFEVYPDQASITDAKNAIATSQLALPKDACDAVYATSGYSASVPNLSRITLATDNVFGDDGGRSQLATMSGSTSAGFQAMLNVGVDTRTTPTAGNAPGRPGSR